MKLYCVFQSSGEYDTFYNHLVGVCDSYEKAQELKNIADENIVTYENCFTIVPEDVFWEWEYDDDTDTHAQTYKGYTLEQYEQQAERHYNCLENYDSAEIREIEMNEYLM